MPTRKFFAVPMRQRKLVISLPGGDNTSNWKLVSADIRAYTSMGDRVADSYAALMPGHGFKRLIDVADQACKHGIGSVADAPPELRTFIAAMEAVPDWLDMAMVEDGTRLKRAGTWLVAPRDTCLPRQVKTLPPATESGRYPPSDPPSARQPIASRDSVWLQV